MSPTLLDIVETIRQDFLKTNDLRDETLRQSRALVRWYANAIRATHGHEWAEAETIYVRARSQ